MSKNVFIEHADHATIKMFEEWGYTTVKDHEEADLICFLGGTDVCSWLYNEGPSPFNQGPDMSRDMACVFLYNYAMSRNIPMVGICRGSQFLTVMSGGKLIQHIPAHRQAHHTIEFTQWARDEGEPKSIGVTSSHHQAMLPYNESDVMARSPDGYVEVALYNDFVPVLAVQGHPEWVTKDNQFQVWFMDAIKRWLMT